MECSRLLAVLSHYRITVSLSLLLHCRITDSLLHCAITLSLLLLSRHSVSTIVLFHATVKTIAATHPQLEKHSEQEC